MKHSFEFLIWLLQTAVTVVISFVSLYELLMSLRNVYHVLLVRTSLYLQTKSRRVCIKTRSTPALLTLKGQFIKHTTVKWTIDCETLSLFTSATDKACLRDLLNSRSFVGEAENVIKEFLSYFG